MPRFSTLAALALIAACGGGTTKPAPEQSHGACSADGSAWSCVKNGADAGASQDGGGSFFLAHCPTGVGSGSCTGAPQAIDTTNPNEPAQIPNGDCLQCGSNGSGTYWSCVSGVWQVQGVYSCQ